MIFKKIWKEENRFFISDDIYLYEDISSNGNLCRRKLQPTFESDLWEVYALHRENGLYYAIIRKIGLSERIFFRNAILFSQKGMFFMLIGQYLAYRIYGEHGWSILFARKSVLVDVTSEFVGNQPDNVWLSDLRYDNQVVEMTFRLPKFYQKTKRFMCDELGYHEV